MGVLRQRAKDRSPCALESLLLPPPRVSNTNDHVYVLFGPRKIWADAENRIQVDIRGLIYEPRARMSRKVEKRSYSSLPITIYMGLNADT